MANTIGVSNGLIVAQRTLETLLARYPVLRQIATDFSSDAKLFNQQVIAKVVSPTTASDYDTTNGYAATDRVMVDVPVTINKHKHHTYSVNDQERSSTALDLIQKWADTAAYALGGTIVSDILALITLTNYANTAQKSVIAAADFDRSSIIDIKTALNLRAVPDMNRFMVLNPAYYGALEKDTTIVANLNNRESDTIVTGVLTNVHGFNVSEYANLPANAINLVGFGGNSEALVLATRLPNEPTVEIPGTIDTVTEPNTGLSVQVREWYDMKLGKQFRTMTLMYGVAIGGSTDKIQLIVSA